MSARRGLGALLAALVWLTSAGPAGGAGFRGGAFEPPSPAPDFALRGSGGTEFRLDRARGKVVVLTFGYTHCPDVCPTVLAELAQMRARLGKAAQRVQVVYVSVDPGRDTPERMRAYTEMFDRTFLGLTGSAEELGPVWKAYGISIGRREIPGGGPGAYNVHHTASLYLVDPAGRLRVMAPFGTPVDDVVHDVRTLLEEPRLAAADGAPARSGSIRLDTPWVRRAPAMADVGPDVQSKTAGYVTIQNRGPSADALVSATSDVAKTVEIHETRNVSGMMTMERVAKIPLAPGARVELNPGGYHLMLIGLARALGPGQSVTLTLVFERAGPVTVRASVR